MYTYVSGGVTVSAEAFDSLWLCVLYLVCFYDSLRSIGDSVWMIIGSIVWWVVGWLVSSHRCRAMIPAKDGVKFEERV